MSDSILINGYQLQMGARQIGKLNAVTGAAAKGFLNSYNKPSGFVPGSHEDRDRGYSYGSEITNLDGDYFKCIDPTAGKAKWIQLGSEITKASYSEDEVEAEKSEDKQGEPEVTPLKKQEEAPPAEPEKEAEKEEQEEPLPEPQTLPGTPAETEPKAEATTEPVAEPKAEDEVEAEKEEETPEPEQKDYSIEELPYSGWLTKAGLKTIADVIEVDKKDGLSTVKGITPPREKSIRGKLLDLGYIE